MPNSQQILVLNFIQLNEGRTVGRGECVDLADGALGMARSKTYTDYSKDVRKGPYKWGDLVPLHQAQQGDIIQFVNFKYTIKYTDGSWESGIRGMPNHTAIFINKLSSGGYKIAEQNAPVLIGDGRGTIKQVRTVQYNIIYLTNEKSGNIESISTQGSIKVYRAVKR